jgi:hypothetical protein
VWAKLVLTDFLMVALVLVLYAFAERRNGAMPAWRKARYKASLKFLFSVLPFLLLGWIWL